jgi:hypothetical protein
MNCITTRNELRVWAAAIAAPRIKIRVWGRFAPLVLRTKNVGGFTPKYPGE